MLVLVGSTNPQKLQATLNAIPNSTVEGHPVPSDVSSQPIGLTETFKGVANRLSNLSTLSVAADYLVAFENGIVPVGSVWIDMAVVGIADTQSRAVQFSTSAGVVVPYDPKNPQAYSDVLKEREEKDIYMPPVVKLAKKLHSKRIEEIKASLKEDEKRFRSLLLEVEEIRSGKWDDKIRQQLAEEQEAAKAGGDTAEAEKPEEPVNQPTEDVSATTSAMDVDQAPVPEQPPNVPEPDVTPMDVDETAKAVVATAEPGADTTHVAAQPPDEPNPVDTQMADVTEQDEAAAPQHEEPPKPEETTTAPSADAATNTTAEEAAASPTTEPPTLKVQTDLPVTTPTETTSPVKSPRKGGRAPKLKVSTTPGEFNSPEVAEVEDEHSDTSKKRMEEKNKIWRKTAMMIWNKIAEHRYGNVFLKPIKEEGYSTFVKQPMNLDLIKARIRDGTISTTAEFHRDVLLCFTNALMYNNEDTGIYDMAMEMREFADTEIRHLILYGDRELSSVTRRHKSVEVEPEVKTAEEQE
ncbi:hypothetical protein HK097_005812 [Rhizophlyctis rosea]|uniref:Bromo domain-containing protein n=1 Tax=Rhizophlyctis rosea TaxID=64517 RepID=A0AAD5SER3_9FUNG|nr:hypothetical protein HK097_005812 [Rhizophlyctis rosea]